MTPRHDGPVSGLTYVAEDQVNKTYEFPVRLDTCYSELSRAPLELILNGGISP